MGKLIILIKIFLVLFVFFYRTPASFRVQDKVLNKKSKHPPLCFCIRLDILFTANHTNYDLKTEPLISSWVFHGIHLHNLTKCFKNMNWVTVSSQLSTDGLSGLQIKHGMDAQMCNMTLCRASMDSAGLWGRQSTLQLLLTPTLGQAQQHSCSCRQRKPRKPTPPYAC